MSSLASLSVSSFSPGTSSVSSYQPNSSIRALDDYLNSFERSCSVVTRESSPSNYEEPRFTRDEQSSDALQHYLQPTTPNMLDELHGNQDAGASDGRNSFRPLISNSMAPSYQTSPSDRLWQLVDRRLKDKTEPMMLQTPSSDGSTLYSLDSYTDSILSNSILTSTSEDTVEIETPVVRGKYKTIWKNLLDECKEISSLSSQQQPQQHMMSKIPKTAKTTKTMKTTKTTATTRATSKRTGQSSRISKQNELNPPASNEKRNMALLTTTRRRSTSTIAASDKAMKDSLSSSSSSSFRASKHLKSQETRFRKNHSGAVAPTVTSKTKRLTKDDSNARFSPESTRSLDSASSVADVSSYASELAELSMDSELNDSIHLSDHVASVSMPKTSKSIQVSSLEDVAIQVTVPELKDDSTYLPGDATILSHSSVSIHTQTELCPTESHISSSSSASSSSPNSNNNNSSNNSIFSNQNDSQVSIHTESAVSPVAVGGAPSVVSLPGLDATPLSLSAFHSAAPTTTTTTAATTAATTTTNGNHSSSSSFPSSFGASVVVAGGSVSGGSVSGVSELHSQDRPTPPQLSLLRSQNTSLSSSRDLASTISPMPYNKENCQPSSAMHRLNNELKPLGDSYGYNNRTVSLSDSSITVARHKCQREPLHITDLEKLQSPIAPQGEAVAVIPTSFSTSSTTDSKSKQINVNRNVLSESVFGSKPLTPQLDSGPRLPQPSICVTVPMTRSTGSVVSSQMVSNFSQSVPPAFSNEMLNSNLNRVTPSVDVPLVHHAQIESAQTGAIVNLKHTRKVKRSPKKKKSPTKVSAKVIRSSNASMVSSLNQHGPDSQPMRRSWLEVHQEQLVQADEIPGQIKVMVTKSVPLERQERCKSADHPLSAKHKEIQQQYSVTEDRNEVGTANSRSMYDDSNEHVTDTQRMQRAVRYLLGGEQRSELTRPLNHPVAYATEEPTSLLLDRNLDQFSLSSRNSEYTSFDEQPSMSRRITPDSINTDQLFFETAERYPLEQYAYPSSVNRFINSLSRGESAKETCDTTEDTYSDSSERQRFLQRPVHIMDPGIDSQLSQILVGGEREQPALSAETAAVESDVDSQSDSARHLASLLIRVAESLASETSSPPDLIPSGPINDRFNSMRGGSGMDSEVVADKALSEIEPAPATYTSRPRSIFSTNQDGVAEFAAVHSTTLLSSPPSSPLIRKPLSTRHAEPQGPTEADHNATAGTAGVWSSVSGSAGGYASGSVLSPLRRSTTSEQDSLEFISHLKRIDELREKQKQLQHEWTTALEARIQQLDRLNGPQQGQEQEQEDGPAELETDSVQCESIPDDGNEIHEEDSGGVASSQRSLVVETGTDPIEIQTTTTEDSLRSADEPISDPTILKSIVSSLEHLRRLRALLASSQSNLHLVHSKMAESAIGSSLMRNPPPPPSPQMNPSTQGLQSYYDIHHDIHRDKDKHEIKDDLSCFHTSSESSLSFSPSTRGCHTPPTASPFSHLNLKDQDGYPLTPFSARTHDSIMNSSAVSIEASNVEKTFLDSIAAEHTPFRTDSLAGSRSRSENSAGSGLSQAVLSDSIDWGSVTVYSSQEIDILRHRLREQQAAMADW